MIPVHAAAAGNTNAAVVKISRQQAAGSECLNLERHLGSSLPAARFFQQMRGSCSPLSMSTMREAPILLFIVTRPEASSVTVPIRQA